MFCLSTRAVSTQYFWLAYLFGCPTVIGQLISIWDDASLNSSSHEVIGDACTSNDAWMLSSLDPGIEIDSQPALHLAQLQAFKLKRKVPSSRAPDASPKKKLPDDKGNASLVTRRAAARRKAGFEPLRREFRQGGQLSPAELRIIYLSVGFFWLLLLILFCSFADTGEWVTQSMAPSAEEVVTKSSDTELATFQRKFRWLLLLFSSSLVLLSFEVILAASAESVTLLADSAHTGADVVGYGVNLLVEWLRIAAKTTLDDQEAKSEAQTAKSVDVWGTLTSLAVLIFATYFAVSQAFHRLHQPTSAPALTLGIALLFFAVISTVMNVGVLCVYQWWHNEDTRAEIEAEVEASAQTGEEADGSSDVEAFCRWKRQISHPRPTLGLNMFTAMLHLVLDAIRSLLILTFALLIMAGRIHDVVRADAFCGFIVAALVAVGFTAMLVRACQLVRYRTSG
mmetsp:Transcript_80902/g.152928  ORF Transcript_80902/g.152928 Transcript_80902/m.152928 type:complete len:453 (+) Transcript_80902:93-1451(+)